MEAGYSADALCSVNDSKKVVHISSLLPSMNQLVVEEGRLPKAADECVVDIDFLTGSGYEVGDKITFLSGTEDKITDTLKTDTYTIVGTVSSPCYISFHRGSRRRNGTGSVSGFVSVLPDSFDLDVYTEMYAAVDGAKELTAFTDEYDDHIDTVIDEVEKIRKTREDARYQEIVDEAENKLNDAKKELEDAKTEADQKLNDAKAKLDDGRNQLENAKAEISNGYAQLEDSRARPADPETR